MSTVFKTKRQRIAWLLIVIIGGNVLSPATSYALTSGPTQPEVQSFQPAGTTDMVDLFTGDFSYNIPLFELPGPNGGYPFNLSYQAGITMEQEASWVGLGWSLNPGAINRQMRGLPDDFNGDEITTKMEIDPSITAGVGAGIGFEVFGAARDIGNLGLSIFYNNYKGFGYSIDASAGFAAASRSGMLGGVELGASISLNSQEGASINPSLSLFNKTGKLGLTANYNALSGLQNVTLTRTKEVKYAGKDKEGNGKTWTGKGGSWVSLSVATPGYTPQVSLPMRNVNVSARINGGAGSWWGAYPKGYVKGFYSEQWLKDNGQEIKSNGYGYLNYDNGAPDAKSVLDFNREKDGIVSKETPNLGIPSLTYDIYSVTGQGIGAMYRPIRNDIGIIHDPETISESTGAGLGVDGLATHVGINLNVNFSRSTSGMWTDNNEFTNQTRFQPGKLNDGFEPWNFKAHGELTGEKKSILDNLGGDDPVRVRLDLTLDGFVASNYLEKNFDWNKELPEEEASDRSRKQRNNAIQPFTKRDILRSSGCETPGACEIIPYFRNNYVTESVPNNIVSASYVRGNDKLDHVAGFTATTPDGLRYNYTIPVYNLTQEEVVFSTNKTPNSDSKIDIETGASDSIKFDYDRTERLLKRTTLPKYAHAYLLTSILGTDYVDLQNDGVTPDDLGYWVKFTYKQTADLEHSYRWREPFEGANYIEGWKTDKRDDKGSYTYGEKELWYLYKAETKSHVAIFNSSKRSDARGVRSRNQNAAVPATPNQGQYSYQLDSVQLYSRSNFSLPENDRYAIKTVQFTYDNSLCSGIPNGSYGKLTLKALQFEYGKGTRGHFNPYKFSYDINPSYGLNKYDRWGTYKPNPVEGAANNIDFPYSDQDTGNKANIDNYAGAWSLTQIQTPSGANIIVNYETDDYGYVQHKQATQMTSMVNPYGSGSVFDLTSNPAIKFKLQKPIPVSDSTNDAGEQKKYVREYLDGLHEQLFFKILIDLRASNEDQYREYISGYADIDTTAAMTLQKANGSDTFYSYGVFSLQQESYKDNVGQTLQVHPFSKRAWQHIRTNQPDLAVTGYPFSKASSNGDKIGLITGLVGMFDSIEQMLQGFYNFCDSHSWGREIDISKSWIRLNSVDKIKYGGGLRVKQITIKDNWKGDKEGVYGQVYDYTIKDGTNVISSGVAAYEPMVGGEENPLRYAKKYTQSVNLKTDNNLFFEYPINENYYPGPQVGYRQVTVTSLAAAALEGGRHLENVTFKDDQDNDVNVFPTDPEKNITFGSTGKTVHEFYTAKDFPVLTDETDKYDAPSIPIQIPIPFLGNVSITSLITTQGYSIITNDMHGKPSRVSDYRQSQNGSWEENPISWVKYNYASDPGVYENENVSFLRNEFVRNTDNDGTLSLFDPGNENQNGLEKYTMGQENEFFVDMRQHEDNVSEGGANGNLDVVFLPIVWAPIPIPTLWPSVGKSNTRLRTSVTNKIIFRPGILESVQAYDGGSIVETRNIKWDRLTGQVVLQTVNNSFDQPIFSYTIPGYTQYPGLSGAYQNVGLKLNIQAFQRTSPTSDQYSFSSNIDNSMLVPGDEMIVYDSSGEPLTRVVNMGMRGTLQVVSSPVVLDGENYTALVVRSGFRNQLNATAGTITALQDPSVKGPDVIYSKQISAPSN